MKIFGLVVVFLCITFLEAAAGELYKAGVLHFDKEMNTNEYAPFVYEAGKTNVDIVVLPSSEYTENYDETVSALSKAAKDASVYVVAHMYEKTRCQNKDELIKSNLVFDREGSIVSVYRKPVSNLANCTSPPSDLVTFTTDFGVTFGLVMNEDLVLHKVEYFKGIKNLVMTGEANSNFLSGPEFFSSWSYVNNVNLISSNGIYVGSSGLKPHSGRLTTANLDSRRRSEESVVPNTSIVNLNSEDLSQYVVKPMDLEASALGLKETVCHRSFCCEYYVKTAGSKSDVSYGLAAFDGLYPFSNQHSIGTQNCAIYACTGLYKRTCQLGPNNSTNTIFQKISITANFTEPNAQYPIVQSTSVLPIEKFKFISRTDADGISTQVTLEIVDGQNLLKFGIFGRDYSKDLETFAVETNNSESTYDIYDYIFNEDVQEFFDYVWIRFRILLVVVSIYVLEMM